MSLQVNTTKGALTFLVLICIPVYGLSLLTGLFVDDATNVINAREAGLNFRELSTAFRFDLQELHHGIVPECIKGIVRYFRPVIVFSFKLDWWLFGNNFRLYHLQNCFFGIGCAVLVFFFSLHFSRRTRVAFWAALFFALFHMNIFSVFWLSARTNVICLFFFLSSLLLFLKASALKGRSKHILLACSFVACCISLLSKETAVILPVMTFLLTVYDLADRGEKSWKTILGRAFQAGLIGSLPVLAYLAARYHYLGGFSIATHHFYIFPLSDPYIVVYCIEKIVLTLFSMIFLIPPLPLNILFSHKWVHVYTCSVGVILLLFLWFIARRVSDKKKFRVLSAMTLTAILPTLPLVPVAHYFYFPSAFYSILLAEFFAGGFKKSASSPDQSPAAGDDQEVPGSILKRIYCFCYFTFTGFCLCVILFLFYAGARVTQNFCRLMKHQYDWTVKHSAAERKVPEFYVFDMDGVYVHAYSEFRLRYPECGKFKFIVVNPQDPMNNCSVIKKERDSLVVKSRGIPFFSGILAYVGNRHRQVFKKGEVLKCDYYTLKVKETRENTFTRFIGVSEFEITFDPDASIPSNRIYLRAPIGREAGVVDFD